MRRAALGGAAALLTTAVTAGLALAPTPAQADGSDAALTAGWTETQLVDGDHAERFGQPDVGLTIDVALALQEVGGHQATVDDVTSFVAENLEQFALPYDDGSYSFTPVNQAAKAAALAVATGNDPTSFGGADLVRVIEKVTPGKGRLAGRISERAVYDGEAQADQANAFGQAFAVHALTAAGSHEAPAARRFLLSQQCEEGFFRLGFSPAAKKKQGCDADKKAVGHVDATALVVVELADVPGRAAREARAAAVRWLAKAQGPDGSYADTAGSAGANTNSTGLAAWAMAQEGSTKAVRKAARTAAGWVQDHQLTDAAGCGFDTADLGAIAYDDAAYEAVQGGSIAEDGDSDQFLRATAQALPALAAVPAKREVAPCA